jgi:hypothetical protein
MLSEREVGLDTLVEAGDSGLSLLMVFADRFHLLG